VFTGRVTGTTNFVETNPFPITDALIHRGQERFNIYCSPCHGRDADGNGITKKLGVMTTVANLHDPRIVKFTDGEIFWVITNGRNTMGAYGPNVPAEDRWAIISYLRALQLSHLGSVDDLSAEERGILKK
jgi:mono/diheme cytochrome c family protein